MLTALLLTVAMNAPAPMTTSPVTAPAATTKPAPQTFLSVDDKSYGPFIQDAHKGKILLVNFWASYCGPCLTEIPELLVLAEKHKGTVDVVFVATDDPDSSAHAASILARRKIALPGSFIVSNPEPRAFITRVDKDWHGEMPTTVLYGPDGTKLKVLIAAHSPAEFEAEIAAAVAATGSKR